MATFLVTYQAIRGYLKQAAKARDDFEEAHQQMSAAAKELCSIWQGKGKEMFEAEQEAFDGWCKQLGIIGKDYSDLVEKALAKYETTDQEITSGWKS